MWQAVINLIQKPYPYYIPYSSSIRLLIILSTMVPLILIVLRPFGLENWNCEYSTLLLAGLTLPIFLALAFNFYLISKALPKFFNEDSWSIGKEIVWSMWNIAVIILATDVYRRFMPICPVNVGSLGSGIYESLLIGFFPAITCITINYNRALKGKLRKVEALNKSLIEHHNLRLGSLIELSGDNEEKVSVPLDDLLYIQSYDNYAKIVWNSDEQLKNKLIRSSLKNLQNQIGESFITRCHRSFIVNLANVEKVIGNARGYKLKLKNYPEPIPISRDTSKTIFQKINDMKLMSV